MNIWDIPGVALIFFARRTLIVFWDAVLIPDWGVWCFSFSLQPQWGKQTNKKRGWKKQESSTYRQVLSRPTIHQSTNPQLLPVTSAGRSIYGEDGPVVGGVPGVETPFVVLPLRTFSLQQTSCESKQRKKKTHENGKHERNSCTANTLLENLRGLSLMLKRGRWPSEPPWRGALSPLSAFAVTLLS